MENRRVEAWRMKKAGVKIVIVSSKGTLVNKDET